METFTVQHVSVWLDGQGPAQGAFAHGLEWAAHLGLPLRAIPLHGPEHSANGLDGCQEACRREGVTWELAEPETNEDEMLPTDLHVIGSNCPKRRRDSLRRQLFRSADLALVLGPTLWRPMSRVLVLNEDRDPESGFLDNVIRLCRIFQVMPVVLTVAHSERVVRLRQQFAEEKFASQFMPTDFDSALTADLRTAVAWAARWRHCSHVFIKRRRTQSGWLRTEHEAIESLIDLSEALALLALPESWQPASGRQQIARLQPGVTVK